MLFLLIYSHFMFNLGDFWISFAPVITPNSLLTQNDKTRGPIPENERIVRECKHLPLPVLSKSVFPIEMCFP